MTSGAALQDKLSKNISYMILQCNMNYIAKMMIHVFLK